MKRVAPAKVRKEAKLGLLLRKKWKRGGTAVGVTRAVQLYSGKAVSDQTIKRMYSYFQRHQHDRLDKDGSDGKAPSNGYIAWLLWGGNSGRKWAEREYKKIKKSNPVKRRNPARNMLNPDAIKFEAKILTKVLADRLNNKEKYEKAEKWLMGNYVKGMINSERSEYILLKANEPDNLTFLKKYEEEKGLPEWFKKAFDKGETVYIYPEIWLVFPEASKSSYAELVMLNFEQATGVRFEHFIDFIDSYNFPNDPSRVSFDQMLELVRQWDTEDVKVSDESKIAEGEKVYKKYSDGMKWVLLTNKEAMQNESRISRMAHCIGRVSDNGTNTFIRLVTEGIKEKIGALNTSVDMKGYAFSLRDSENNPYLTAFYLTTKNDFSDFSGYFYDVKGYMNCNINTAVYHQLDDKLKVNIQDRECNELPSINSNQKYLLDLMRDSKNLKKLTGAENSVEKTLDLNKSFFTDTLLNAISAATDEDSKASQFYILSDDEIENFSMSKLEGDDPVITGLSIYGNVKKIPDGLKIIIDGGLDLSNSKIESLPEGMTIYGDLFLDDCKKIKSLPKNLIVKGDLYARNCHALEEVNLSKNLMIVGNIDLEKCISLKTLSSDQKEIYGNLNLSNCVNLESISGNIRDINGDLIMFRCLSLKKLPAELNIEGTFKLSNANELRFLPNKLSVQYDLSILYCNSIIYLPDGLYVGRNLSLTNVPLIKSIPKQAMIHGSISSKNDDGYEELKQENPTSLGDNQKYITSSMIQDFGYSIILKKILLYGRHSFFEKVLDRIKQNKEYIIEKFKDSLSKPGIESDPYSNLLFNLHGELKYFPISGTRQFNMLEGNYSKKEFEELPPYMKEQTVKKIEEEIKEIKEKKCGIEINENTLLTEDIWNNCYGLEFLKKLKKIKKIKNNNKPHSSIIVQDLVDICIEEEKWKLSALDRRLKRFSKLFDKKQNPTKEEEVNITKEYLLELARECGERPHKYSDLGIKLGHYSRTDKSFKEKMKELCPDWFNQSSGAREETIAAMQMFLEMARNGDKRPSQASKLGQALTSLMRVYPEFEEKIYQANREWTYRGKAEAIRETKNYLVELARECGTRPRMNTNLGMKLASYLSLDKEFKEKIKELCPDWFIKSSGSREETKAAMQMFLEMARNGEKRPGQRSKDPEEKRLGKLLNNILRMYPDFRIKLLEANRDWFSSEERKHFLAEYKEENPTKEEEVDITKEYLLELARECGKRPPQDTDLGKKLTVYVLLDKSFKEKIKELCPDWFIKSSGPREKTIAAMEMFLEMAKDGKKRPSQRSKDPQEKKLAITLSNFIRIYPEFEKKIYQANREWTTKGQAEAVRETKNYLVGLAKECGTRPPKDTALGKKLANYLLIDKSFKEKIKELCPDWFKGDYGSREETIAAMEMFLEMARNGEKRPTASSKDPEEKKLGRLLTSMLHQHPHFRKKVLEANRDWFNSEERKTFLSEYKEENPTKEEEVNITKEYLLELARECGKRPPQDTALGKRFSNYLMTDKAFKEKIKELCPKWFRSSQGAKEKTKAAMEMFLEMARNGEKRPAQHSKDPEEKKLGKALTQFLITYPEFEEKIYQANREWTGRGQIEVIRETKNHLIELARECGTRPPQDTALGYKLNNYLKTDKAFKEKIKELCPDWLRSGYGAREKTIVAMEMFLEMARNGEKRPNQRSKDPEENKLGKLLASLLDNYPEFRIKLLEANRDWFTSEKRRQFLAEYKEENPTKEEEVNITKEYLLELARECGKRPTKDTPLGSKLDNYMQLDRAFKEKVKELCPDWFIKGSGPRKETKATMEMFLEMARNREKRPSRYSKDPEEKKLGSTLAALMKLYPEFQEKIYQANRDWTAKGEAEIIRETKNHLLELARECGARPPRDTALGFKLNNYMRLDRAFNEKVKELCSDWFKTPKGPREETKAAMEMFLEMARNGEKRPGQRSKDPEEKKLGTSLTNILIMYPDFRKKLLEANRDWFSSEERKRFLSEYKEENPLSLIARGFDERPASAYDREELKLGIKTELEHTDDAIIASKIAKDHLDEDSNYYSKLIEMERA